MLLLSKASRQQSPYDRSKAAQQLSQEQGMAASSSRWSPPADRGALQLLSCQQQAAARVRHQPAVAPQSGAPDPSAARLRATASCT